MKYRKRIFLIIWLCSQKGINPLVMDKSIERTLLANLEQETSGLDDLFW
jgi:hypothetical protein